jgi:pimeloyl-ACP methyl ester carboxylesterase
LATGVFCPQKVILIASAGIAKRKSLRNGVMMLMAKIGKAITAVPPFSFARESLRKKLYKKLGSDYGSAGALKQTFLNVVREDLSESAHAISVPTLLIWGDRDTETPLVDGERLSRLISRSKLEIISGAGHFVHREKSKEVAEIIKDFLASP